jgi:hypothetical protein
VNKGCGKRRTILGDYGATSLKAMAEETDENRQAKNNRGRKCLAAAAPSFELCREVFEAPRLNLA